MKTNWNFEIVFVASVHDRAKFCADSSSGRRAVQARHANIKTYTQIFIMYM